MTHYIVTCKYCRQQFDSPNSVGESIHMLNSHIERSHPDNAAPLLKKLLTTQNKGS